jgi:hypothetical protein
MQLPAEFIGGPWDGKLMTVQWHTVQIVMPKAHPVALTQIKKSEYYTGVYSIRNLRDRTAQGCYYYDWKGWDTVKNS